MKPQSSSLRFGSNLHSEKPTFVKRPQLLRRRILLTFSFALAAMFLTSACLQAQIPTSIGSAKDIPTIWSSPTGNIQGSSSTGTQPLDVLPIPGSGQIGNRVDINFQTCVFPDISPPVLDGIPGNDTLNCTDTVPPSPVTVSDNCPGVMFFESLSMSSYECGTGLEAWWPAEGNGNDAQAGLKASLMNGTTFQSGIAGQGFSFDGQDDYLTVRDTVEFSGDYSLAFWINSTETQDQTIFSASEFSNGKPAISAKMNAAGQVSFEQKFPLGTISGGSTLLATDPFNDGNWHQVVMRKEGDQLSLIIDNTIADVAVDTNQVEANLKVTMGRLSFVNSTNNEYFQGGIDELRVYSKGICEATIQGLYLSGIDNGTWAPTFRLTRIWTAMDAAGNASQASQVLLFDNMTPPTLNPPPPITLFSDGSAGLDDSNPQIQAWLSQLDGQDDCSCGVVSYTLPPVLPTVCGGTATNVITFSMADECGNITTANSSITVEDTTAPTITCPNVLVNASSNGSCTEAMVYYAVTANDYGSQGVSLSYSIPDSSLFSLGTTMVTATAQDLCGNTAQCSFSVTVDPPANGTINATIDGCQDQIIGCGDNANISIDITGTGPWEVVTTDGSTNDTATVVASPYVFTVSPQITKTYRVLDVISLAGSCTGNICGSATIAQKDDCPVPLISSSESQSSDDGDCDPFNLASALELDSLLPNGNRLIKVKVGPHPSHLGSSGSLSNSSSGGNANIVDSGSRSGRGGCGGSRSGSGPGPFGSNSATGSNSSDDMPPPPNYIDLSVPAGVVVAAYTDNGLTVNSATGDSVTSLHGVRVESPPNDSTFFITYQIGPDSNGCMPAFCTPLIAYGRDSCIEYQVAGVWPAHKNNGLEAQVHFDLDIYPNPNNGTFRLKYSGLEAHDVALQITDMQGKVLFQDTKTETSLKGKWNLKMETLPKGIYLLRFKSGTQLKTRKMVIQ